MRRSRPAIPGREEPGWALQSGGVRYWKKNAISPPRRIGLRSIAGSTSAASPGRTSRAASGVARYGPPTYIHTASPIHVKDNQAHTFAPHERLHVTHPRVITDSTDA